MSDDPKSDPKQPGTEDQSPGEMVTAAVLSDTPIQPPVPPAEIDDREIEREVRRLSRRGFVGLTVAAAVGYASWKWLRSRPREGGLPWPIRRVLLANEALS